METRGEEASTQREAYASEKAHTKVYIQVHAIKV